MMRAHTSDSIEIAVMRTLCKRVRSVFSRRYLELLDNPEVLEIDISINDYSQPEPFARDFMIYSLLRKWKGWSFNYDTYGKAFGAWTSAECLCASTNQRFENQELPKWALPLISEMQRKISKVLGPFNFEEVTSRCKWSKGATYDRRRSESALHVKMSRVISVTQRALPHLMSVMDEKWLHNLPCVPYKIVRGNRGVMVAKTSKTDRPIAAEPSGNSFLQQGVGRYIRHRLKGFGVDLDCQKRNQEDAFRALADGLATVDLSSASDTLSLSVVRLLLPDEWYQYLADLRSPVTSWNKDGHKATYYLSKFSSMGNAFTFELETLVFWALSKTLSEWYSSGYCSIYGDDIVIPKEVYTELKAGLTFFGFIINDEKSYSSGLFYESCGKQYHSLEDVTPAFQKEVVGSNLSELIRFHNRLYRWGKRTDQFHIVKDALSQVIDFTLTKHPKLRGRLPSVPDFVVGDSGFLADCSQFKTDRHGDYICTALVEFSDHVGLIYHPWVNGLYCYKLRSPGFSNVFPNGHTATESGAKSRILKGYKIWRSSHE